MTLVAKKDDPNYEQIRGHVPKHLARQFKQYCLDEEIDFSEGLERILVSFLTDLDTPKKNPFRRSGQR